MKNFQQGFKKNNRLIESSFIDRLAEFRLDDLKIPGAEIIPN
jgi:hypothetical protein